jgi:hypothetical protein
VSRHNNKGERKESSRSEKLWTADLDRLFHQLGGFSLMAGGQPCASKRVDVLIHKASKWGACGERGSMTAVFVNAAVTRHNTHSFIHSVRLQIQPLGILEYGSCQC